MQQTSGMIKCFWDHCRRRRRCPACSIAVKSQVFFCEQGVGRAEHRFKGSGDKTSSRNARWQIETCSTPLNGVLCAVVKCYTCVHSCCGMGQCSRPKRSRLFESVTFSRTFRRVHVSCTRHAATGKCGVCLRCMSMDFLARKWSISASIRYPLAAHKKVLHNIQFWCSGHRPHRPGHRTPHIGRRPPARPPDSDRPPATGHAQKKYILCSCCILLLRTATSFTEVCQSPSGLAACLHQLVGVRWIDLRMSIRRSARRFEARLGAFAGVRPSGRLRAGRDYIIGILQKYSIPLVFGAPRR